MIVGIDEVGRGCWAGPLCVVAVAGDEARLQGVRDSKQLSRKKRTELYKMIVCEADGIGIGWVSAPLIDKYGLSKALEFASKTAYGQLGGEYEGVIIDGTFNFLGLPSAVTMKKADESVAVVSAASIVAKVLRDTYMQRIDEHFPNYGFAKHVGYGTKAHAEALAKFGPSAMHRHSFAPIKALVPTQPKSTAGQIAENRAADHLRGLGYEVIDRNWKTKWCEVDIIAVKDGVTHFVEVKYRRNNSGGTGFDAITSRKLKQMQFAAELWVKRQNYVGQYQLSAVALTGDNMVVSEFLETV